MLPYDALQGLPTFAATWLTIGNFDGIHLGHQQIIRAVVSGAHADGQPAIAITFDPHPATVLGGVSVPKITTQEEKTQQLQALGIDHVIYLPFTKELAALTAEDFMGKLHAQLRFTHLVTGFDFALGRGRSGNNDVLRQLGEKLGYGLTLVPALEIDGSIVSSTNIRNAILAGAFGSANSWLGRAYNLSGTVIHGDGRGRTINIPTSNVNFPLEKVAPAPGVYACVVQVGDGHHFAVSNIGYRPTFTENAPLPRLEAHLLDFSGDLYGQQMRVEFIQRIRPEIKFNGVQELIAQIQKDIIVARGTLQQECQTR